MFIFVCNRAMVYYSTIIWMMFLCIICFSDISPSFILLTFFTTPIFIIFAFIHYPFVSPDKFPPFLSIDALLFFPFFTLFFSSVFWFYSFKLFASSFRFNIPISSQSNLYLLHCMERSMHYADNVYKMQRMNPTPAFSITQPHKPYIRMSIGR